MDIEEYRTKGKNLVEYIAKYLDNIRSRRVFPDVTPGYMRKLVKDSAPEEGEAFDDIFKDVERVIMPGITHWQSPHMHAFFPSLNSFPSLLGDLLSGGIGCNALSWASSPACTELETIMTDWLGKMIGLPEEFLHGGIEDIDALLKHHEEVCTKRTQKPGVEWCDCRKLPTDSTDGGPSNETMSGGVLQTTAGESTVVALLAARAEALERYDKLTNPNYETKPNKNPDHGAYHAKLVAYCSDQAHPCVKKAAKVGLVKLRYLPTDDDLCLRGEALREQVARDKQAGLVPFFLCATLGTMGTCAFDNLAELGPVCKELDMWLHVDAAYAGAAFLCPEYRHLMAGVEHAHSFVLNPSQWMMVTFECCTMWVKDSRSLHKALVVNPLYLEHPYTGVAIDYMNWQVGLSKRFRALKLWFVIRAFGVKGLQKHIREGIRRATYFEGLVGRDSRFEIPAKGQMGLVVFRLKGDRKLTELLMRRLNKSGKLLVDAALAKDTFMLRFVVTSQHTSEADIDRDWRIIRETATEVLLEMPETPETREVPEMQPMKRVKLNESASAKGTASASSHQLRECLQNTFGLTHNLSFALGTELVNGSFAAFATNNECKDSGLDGDSIHMNGHSGMNGHSNGMNGHSDHVCCKCGDVAV